MSPLITLDDLGDATLLDVRYRLGGPPAHGLYLEGHIPGAVFCDLDADLAAPPGPDGRHPLPDAASFQAAMRRLGVSNGRRVVVYDDQGNLFAARAWWTLRYFGHQDVRVLDGGLQGPLVQDEPEIAEGDFTARPGGMPILTADEAAALAAAGTLFDARAGERYRGEVEPIDPVAGHVPGAVSAPTTENLGPDGRFLSSRTLRDRFTALGAGDRVGAYCGSGVTAAHEVLALEVAGLPAALYVGSWSNWVSDPTRPVATG
ncbi:sulfurtransferase [Nonomuraea sediminis]|uniref:sulfurtransferase n=1 Tax=Nonomuraea sediminis TaxID=2835864 RepID=UPI001BDBDC42|nr:sulfurtransferase [Nonomuraea sediminis]